MTDFFAAPVPDIGFTGSPLDRADALRQDEAAMAEVRGRADARWLVFDGLDPLMPVGAPGLLWLARDVVDHDAVSVFLGLCDGIPHFASAAAAGPRPGQRTEARTAASALAAGASPGDAAIVAHARSLLDWHARHRFCANCGSATRVVKAGYERKCDTCGAAHFPRTDPVVIMLALREDKALVGRQPRFPKRFFSALAGFVEPGESLEEAVARELFEEAGIRIGRVRYVASQPWPFPSNLMIGAFAEALGFDLVVDGAELEEARWVTKDEARAALAGTGEWLAPPPLAIAHTLFRQWVG
ncbi:MAG: NAD(+) diphosphatase [Janthinobacterium lividum]